ncbi:MAG: alginate O-acetyltransferase AlgX-related protein, partial [bacterium]
ALRDFIGEYVPDEQQLKQWSRGLKRKQAWLNSLGVRYLLVPIPGKLSIYSEYLPDRIGKIAGTTRLQGFRAHLLDMPESDFVVDAYRVLLEAKPLGQMYFRTDTHWNDDGAYQVYAKVMQELNVWYPDLQPVPLSRFSRVPKRKKGDIAQASGLPLDFIELAEALHLTNPCAGEDYRVLESFVRTQAYQEIPKRLPEVNGCENKVRKAIVIHDSFGHFLKQFLNESFKEVVYMPSYDLFGMKSFIQEFQPDVLIDFRVERRFHLLLELDDRMAAELGVEGG